jgi:molybdate transport system substrate-binding protein
MKRTTITAALLAALTLAACTGSGSDPEAQQVWVSAAASLTDVFAEVEAAFEDAHPGIDVVLNLGGSASLREQILEGAPVDVFASANESNMEQVVDAGGVDGSPQIFVRNLMQIAVPTGNPAGITGLADFANEELLIGICAAAVPCGDFGRQVLENAGVVAAPDTNEPDVRALLTKIEAGELDAGLVYVTDIASTDGVDAVTIPEDHNVFAEYPIAVLDGTSSPAGAAAFVDFVLSDAGQAILLQYGFSSP